MPVVVSNGAVNTSAASNVLTAVSHNVSAFNSTSLVLTSTRTITLTTDGTPHGIRGVILALVPSSAVIDRSLRLVLKRAGVTQSGFPVDITAAAITNSTTERTADAWIVFCDFGATITGVDNTASWTLEISQTGGTTGNWNLRTSNGSVAFHVEVTDKVATLANNDTLIDKDGMTCDASLTLRGTLGTGESAYAPALIICKGATPPTQANTVGFKLGSGVTLQINGGIFLGAHSCFRSGSASARVSGTHLQFITATVGTQTGVWDSTISSTITDSRKMSFMVWGSYPAQPQRLELAAGISAGATSATSTAPGGWAAGDTIFITKSLSNATDTFLHTVTSVDGTTINFTPAVTVARAATTATQPAYIVRTSGYGFKMSGPAVSAIFRMTQPSHLVLDGFEFYQIGGGTTNLSRNITTSLDDTANKSQWLVSRGSFWHAVGSSLFSLSAPSEGMLIEYTDANNVTLLAASNKGTGNGPVTYRHNIAMNSTLSGGFSFSTLDVVTDNYHCNTGRGHFILSGAGGTFLRNICWATGGDMVVLNSAHNWSWGDNTYDRSVVYAIRTIAASVNLLTIGAGDKFGTEVPNTPSDIQFTNLSFTQFEYSGLDSPATVDTATLLTALPGSYLRVADYNATPGDYRSWYPEGRFVSTTLGGLPAIEATCQAASSILTNTYQAKSGTVAGLTIYFAVTVQKSSAATTAQLVIEYDNGLTSTATAAASTDAQTISVAVTPAVNAAPVRIRLRQTGNTSAVVWAGVVSNIRSYGYRFGAYGFDIDQTTDETRSIYAAPAANPFILEPNPAVVAAYSGIAVDHELQRVTVTENHTIRELYDYSQWDLAQGENVAVPAWLTTLDGTTYTSVYDIYVGVAGTPGIALTGDNTIIFSAPNDFVSVNGGYFTGSYIDQDGTFVPLVLSGLVSGSTVQIYDVTAAEELYSGIVSASTLSLTLEYRAGHTVRTRVRRADYLAYSYSGFMSPTGQNLNVSQIPDAVYTANGIDGEGALEFILYSGAEVWVYIEAPPFQTSGQRLYNWYKHITALPEYISDSPDSIVALTRTQYRFYNTLKLTNLDTENALIIVGCNITDQDGNASTVFDTSYGRGSIFINAATVEPTNVLTPAQDSRLAAALTKAQFLGLQ